MIELAKKAAEEAFRKEHHHIFARIDNGRMRINRKEKRLDRSEAMTESLQRFITGQQANRQYPYGQQAKRQYPYGQQSDYRGRSKEETDRINQALENEDDD